MNNRAAANRQLTFKSIALKINMLEVYRTNKQKNSRWEAEIQSDAGATCASSKDKAKAKLDFSIQRDRAVSFHSDLKLALDIYIS